VAIVGAWMVAVSFYYVNYRLGFTMLLGLSLLHVVLEFPLNQTVMADITRRIGSLSGRGWTPAAATAPAPAPARRDGRGQTARQRRRR
jgi:hypothetical protein